ncbi:peptidase family M1 [Ancylostoma caninum]|uniref:Peptidase family M1 n=1 Tax=Ancylostoma caninum TaxID=29170 RepID=A0A368GT27_ANCCA|nr:peptidase family M1 [Ancylostoma caninum]
MISVHYDMKVKVYLPNYVDFPHEKDFTFDGDVEITLKIIETVKKIVLNLRDIKINKEKSTFYVGNEKIEIEKVEPLPKLEKVDIVLAKPVERGKEAKLRLIYTGIISNKLGGLYQTTYHEKDGTKKVAAVTQLEPTDARGFLPCFDEPHLKATWNVTVIHPKGTNAISNGIELEGGRQENGDWITTKFTQTPRMSSYLLAIMVNEFEYIEGKTKSGVLFRIWSRPDAKNMTQYALYAGIKCLEFYEKLFDFKFPLAKQG